MYILIGGLTIADFIQKWSIPRVYFLLIFHLMQYCHYHTAGFVCEVLICVNYASCRELTNFNSALQKLGLADKTCYIVFNKIIHGGQLSESFSIVSKIKGTCPKKEK